MHSLLRPDALASIALAALLGWLLTAAARWIAPRVGMLDAPDGARKSHKTPMPLLGGVAVFVGLVASWLLAAASGWDWIPSDAHGRRTAATILLSGSLFCLVGLWDDRRILRARNKLLLQIVACLPYVLAGRCIDTVHVFGYAIELGWLGLAFTIFWLVGCSNVLNLVDGLDGLAGTTALIMALAVAVLSALQGNLGITAMSLLFAGSLLGFLVHNWPPAKIYLGDSGSLTIGFLVGALAIESALKRATGFALAIPLVLVSVPVFDTTMAIVRRKLTGRSIGEADRGHIHHCLQDRGLTRWQSLMVISGLCLEMAAATLLSACFGSDLLAVTVCLSMLAVLIVGRVFGYQETVLVFRYVRAVSHALASTPNMVRARKTLARVSGLTDAGRVADDWSAAVDRLSAAGATRLELLACDPTGAGPARRRLWSSDEPHAAAGPRWQIRLTVPQSNGELDITAHVTGRSPTLAAATEALSSLPRLLDRLCRNGIAPWNDAVEYGPADDSVLRMSPRIAVPADATPAEPALTERAA